MQICAKNWVCWLRIPGRAFMQGAQCRSEIGTNVPVPDEHSQMMRMLSGDRFNSGKELNKPICFRENFGALRSDAMRLQLGKTRKIWPRFEPYISWAAQAIKMKFGQIWACTKGYEISWRTKIWTHFWCEIGSASKSNLTYNSGYHPVQSETYQESLHCISSLTSLPVSNWLGLAESARLEVV